MMLPERVVKLQQNIKETQASQLMGGDNSRYYNYPLGDDLPNVTGWQKIQISSTRDRYAAGYALYFGIRFSNKLSFGHLQGIKVFKNGSQLNFTEERWINIFDLVSDYCYVDPIANMAIRLELLGAVGQGYFTNTSGSTIVMESALSDYLQWAAYIYNLNCMTQTTDFTISLDGEALANIGDGKIVYNEPSIIAIYGAHS